MVVWGWKRDKRDGEGSGGECGMDGVGVCVREREVYCTINASVPGVDNS